MITPWRPFGVILAFSILTGCGSALERWESDNAFMVAAVGLQPGWEAPAYALVGDQKKEYLGKVVNDSEVKCSKFLNGLVLAQNTSNTSLDFATTVFSALATAFTPIATIHALTAGATITSGWKNSLNADVYARATIANYAQAIQATYYTRLNDYMNALTDSNADGLVISLEVGKIRTIHKECSLASAQSSISATLQSTQQGTSATATDTWIVTGDFKVGDTFTLIAKSSSLAAGQIGASVTVRRGETAADLSGDLINAVNLDPGFQKAGISAARDGTTRTIVLRSPAGITWSVEPSGQTTFQHQGRAVSGVESSRTAVPSAGPPSGARTQGAVPGSAIR